MGDVGLEGVEISDLRASKVWSDHRTAPLPRWSVSVEDAMAEYWDESLGASWSQGIVLEAGRQDMLQILGLDGGND